MALASLVGTARAQLDRKPVRYAAVSAVAVLVTQTVLIVSNGVIGIAPAVSNVLAVSVGSIPSYLLNRYWVWGKRSRNRFWREVVPFWSMALLGLAFSTLLVWLAARWNDAVWVVSLANLTAFGVLWVGKYLVLDSILFKVVEHHVEDDAGQSAVDAGPVATSGP